eukprot:9543464-Ditylum_brightwellii.AAC.1
MAYQGNRTLGTESLDRINQHPLQGTSAPPVDGMALIYIKEDQKDSELIATKSKVVDLQEEVKFNYVTVEMTVDLDQEAWKEHTCLASIASH